MSFIVHRPDSVDEATAVLAQYGDDARPLAGGTAFSLLYKHGLMTPARVVCLDRVPGLSGVEVRNGGVWVGALTTHRAVERSDIIVTRLPALGRACGLVGSVRIRSMATLGGNLVHADPAHDPPPVLIALGAVAHIAGPRSGERDVPVESFFVDHYTTVLEPGEILTGVTVPIPGDSTNVTYLAFQPRSADDYATVSVAASLTTGADGTIEDARVVLGGCGPTPRRVSRVERALAGRKPSHSLFAEAASVIGDEIDPLDDVRGSAAYKRAMAAVWVRRALGEVAVV